MHWFGNLKLCSLETYDSDFSLTTLKRVIISKVSGVVKMIEKKKKGQGDEKRINWQRSERGSGPKKVKLDT